MFGTLSRVCVSCSSNFTAAENVEDPAQILIGVTALGPEAEKAQADWPGHYLVTANG